MCNCYASAPWRSSAIRSWSSMYLPESARAACPAPISGLRARTRSTDGAERAQTAAPGLNLVMAPDNAMHVHRVKALAEYGGYMTGRLGDRLAGGVPEPDRSTHGRPATSRRCNGVSPKLARCRDRRGDGKEGVGGSSPSEGFLVRKISAKRQLVLSVLIQGSTSLRRWASIAVGP